MMLIFNIKTIPLNETGQLGRVGNKVSMIYIMDIYHDFIMIFCSENMIYIDENIRTILL
jgi:hypothetical protein